MPFVQIHTSRAVSPEMRRALGGTLARAYAEHMQTSSRIVNVGFVHYAEGEPARYDGTDEAPREMVIVSADVRAGREPAHLAALGRAFTAVCAQALGVGEERVAVYLTEHASHQIYRDGGTAPAWTPAEGATP
jgi:phenylpyruvate tautomerase PptA (4-oxalocrotonate tautomerase family)